MRRTVAVLVLLGICGMPACNAARYGVKQDTWIQDCDTLTQEIARIHQGMAKDEVVRLLGNESWIIFGQIGSDDDYHQRVVYNYNEECLKIRGQAPPQARRQVLIEYVNQAVDQVIDHEVNAEAGRRLRFQ